MDLRALLAPQGTSDTLDPLVRADCRAAMGSLGTWGSRARLESREDPGKREILVRRARRECREAPGRLVRTEVTGERVRLVRLGRWESAARKGFQVARGRRESLAPRERTDGVGPLALRATNRLE